MRSAARPLGLALVLLILPAMAQSTKPTTEPSTKPHPRARESAAPELGSIADGVYRNSSLNLAYKIPFGWVDRTSGMREGSEPGRSVVLLSVFERPPEAQAEGINPAVVIAAESVSSYPGLRTAADYLGPISELATSQGFKVANAPYEFSVGARRLVRADFVKARDSGAVQQTSLVLLEKNWIISFTFLGTSDDEIDELLSRLSFGSPPASRSLK